MREVVISGVTCKVEKKKFPDGVHNTYTFKVEGWEECTVTGLRTAKRVIRGRQSTAVKNTMEPEKRRKNETDI